MIYSQKVLDHFYCPRQGYRMLHPDYVGKSGKAGEGPFMLLYLKIMVGGDTGQVVKESSFQTYGCGPAIAAGSVLAEHIQGKKISEIEHLSCQDIIGMLDGIPPEKKHCCQLAADALQDALLQIKALKR